MLRFEGCTRLVPVDLHQRPFALLMVHAGYLFDLVLNEKALGRIMGEDGEDEHKLGHGGQQRELSHECPVALPAAGLGDPESDQEAYEMSQPHLLRRDASQGGYKEYRKRPEEPGNLRWHHLADYLFWVLVCYIPKIGIRKVAQPSYTPWTNLPTASAG